MARPKFSIVIPVYKQGEFVGEAIDSVLNQTYSDFEILVVNDASPDQTDDVIKRYRDPRVKYLKHSKNKGLPAARNSGMRASKGEIIALLDADDFFHPDKLLTHVNFLESHPEIDVTYNPRFDLNHNEKTIRALYRPKLTVDLADLVLGFQFSPSDMVFRRTAMDRVGWFDDALVNGAEDMDYPCRLALDGCKFASVDKALNYRRYHLNRNRRNMQKRKVEYDLVLNRVFQSARCPMPVRALHNKAIAKRTLNLAFVSLSYEDTKFGQDLLREVVLLDSDIVAGEPAEIIDFFVIRAINNGIERPDVELKKLFNQFPPELLYLKNQYDWAVRQAYLICGARAVVWGNPSQGAENLVKAAHLGANIDKSFYYKLLVMLKDIEEVIGTEAFLKAQSDLFPMLHQFDHQSWLQKLEGNLFAAKAFTSYSNRKYQQVQSHVLKAIRNCPELILNKGIASIFFHSLIKRINPML